MSWPEGIGVDALLSAYLVSNTPSYLYRHLRDQDSVRVLASLRSPESLASILKGILEQESRSAEDVAKAYAALAAISRHEYANWRQLVADLDVSCLRWGRQIVEIMKGQAVSTGVVQALATTLDMGLTGSASATSPTVSLPSPAPRITVGQ